MNPPPPDYDWPAFLRGEIAEQEAALRRMVSEHRREVRERDRLAGDPRAWAEIEAQALRCLVLKELLSLEG